MWTKKLVKLFYNYLEKPLNLNGLILEPVLSLDGLKIILKIKNHSVSYKSNIVDEFLRELEFEFLNTMGLASDDYLFTELPDILRLKSNESVYISPTLREEINQSLSKIKNSVLIYREEKESVSFKCHFVEWYVSDSGNDSINFYIKLIVINPTLNGSKINYKELYKWLNDFSYSDDYTEETENIVDNCFPVFFQNKNLLDKETMYINVIIDFLDSNGNYLIKNY